jgi:hypothetical protein
MGIKDKIAAIQAESDASRDTPLPDSVRGERRNPSVVHSLRLRPEDYEAITAIAHEANVPVGALIRGWVLSGLAQEHTTTLKAAIDRLIADADHIRRLTDA